VLDAPTISRRTFLIGAAGIAASAMTACTGSAVERSASTSASPPKAAPPSPSPALPADCPPGGAGAPLWEVAGGGGLAYGSSAATWQLADADYRRLFERQAGVLFTEDDLLWWRLRPTPTSALRFAHADEIVGLAEQRGMLILGAHLVWDQGFGKGWTDSDFVTMGEAEARRLLYGTVDAVVDRYRGRVAGWIVANEVVDAGGLRIDVPWYSLLGDGYVAEAFRRAHEADPNALLLLNDYGFEVDDASGLAENKRAAALRFLDSLLEDGVPVHALGVQAHLNTATFGAFDPGAYRAFLSAVADRGLKIVVTEMDVLDDGLPVDVARRDAAVADVYRTYLDTALAEPSVIALITFGLSDRYTWLQEDYPRDDGAARRPLPFDDALRPTPALAALEASLGSAPARSPFWLPPRCAA
jgi:endo-1,4-beta-xylanase